MRIVFMGTPDFAVTALQAIQESPKHEVLAVVTQPDQPKGRGYQWMPPPVKVYAQSQGLPVYQPTTLKNDDFYGLLSAWSADAIVVVAYGKILPLAVLQAAKYGCLNIHGSILPKYRGAAPIQRALIAGEAEMGVTIIQMDAGIDTGDMLCVKSTPVLPQDNFESMHDRLAVLGAQALLETLDAIADGSVQAVPQEHSQMTYAAKIEKADCLLDFTKTATELWNQIRGLSPVPLAYTYLNGAILKITEACVAKETGNCGEAGCVIALEKDRIEVACGSGSLYLLRVIPQGKGKMSAGDLIRGRKIALQDRLVPSLEFNEK